MVINHGESLRPLIRNKRLPVQSPLRGIISMVHHTKEHYQKKQKKQNKKQNKKRESQYLINNIDSVLRPLRTIVSEKNLDINFFSNERWQHFGDAAQ